MIPELSNMVLSSFKNNILTYMGIKQEIMFWAWNVQVRKLGIDNFSERLVKVFMHIAFHFDF